MRSLKIKFNSATGEGKSDRVYYLIIRNPMIHSSKTGCNSSIYGWDSNISALPMTGHGRMSKTEMPQKCPACPSHRPTGPHCSHS